MIMIALTVLEATTVLAGEAITWKTMAGPVQVTTQIEVMHTLKS